MQNRRITFLFIFAISAFLILRLPTGCFAAESFRAQLIDDADIFSDEEETDILQAMISFTDYGNALVATADKNDAGTVQKLAVKYYDQAFGTDSGAVFLFDMDDREIYWYSEGDMYDQLSVKSAMAITDNVYRFASDGDFAGCAKEAFAQAVAVLEGGRIRQTMKYYGNALLAIIIALFINYIILRRTSFIRPCKKDEDGLYTDYMELAWIAAEEISRTETKSVQAEMEERKMKQGTRAGRYSGGSSYGGSYSSGGGSSGGGYSGGWSSGSSGSSSGSSGGYSGSKSSGSRGSSNGHHGGGAGHRF